MLDPWTLLSGMFFTCCYIDQPHSSSRDLIRNQFHMMVYQYTKINHHLKNSWEYLFREIPPRPRKWAWWLTVTNLPMGLLPDTQNCGLRKRRKCRERFSRHRIQINPLVSDPDMHHGTCVTHVPSCIPGSLTRGRGENVPGISGACASRNVAWLARGPLLRLYPSQVMNLLPLMLYMGRCVIIGLDNGLSTVRHKVIV